MACKKTELAIATTRRVVGRHGGKATIEITDAGLEQIKRDRANGLSLGSIAARLGMNRSTLREVAKRDERVDAAIAEGHAVLEKEVVDLLLTAARKGNMIAAIFISKTRLGYRETGPSEDSHGAVVNVNITFPAALSSEQYAKTIDVEARVAADE